MTIIYHTLITVSIGLLLYLSFSVHFWAVPQPVRPADAAITAVSGVELCVEDRLLAWVVFTYA